MALIACNTGDKKSSKGKDSYEKAKESLEEHERKNPVKFISVTSKDKHNLLGQTVIKGSVTNNAKICTYKDIELELNFFSKTGTFLEKDHETIYDAIAPGNSSSFKTKYFAPKGTENVVIKVIGAKAD